MASDYELPIKLIEVALDYYRQYQVVIDDRIEANSQEAPSCPTASTSLV